MDQQRDLPPTGLATIENDVGPEVYHELVVDFLSHLPLYLTDLRAAADMSDVPAARYVAHQIKGNALSFGAGGLDALAERLLTVGKAEGALLRPLVGEVEQEIAQLQVSLGEGTDEAKMTPEEYKQLLADLLGHLPAYLASLRIAGSNADVPRAKYVAHQMKDYASALHADVLERLADRLLSLRAEEGDVLRLIVAEVEQEALQFQEDNSVSTLESDVGGEMYQELVAEFLGHFPLYMSALHNAALMSDVPAARYVAHQIKGNALSFGAIRLDSLADRMLRVGKEEGDVLRALVGEIDVEVARLQTTLRR